MREVAAELERPVLLFSGGKDSIVLLRLAEKAFRPGRFPFPLMHVDTGHNFPEAIEFRDRRVAELGERLVVASVQESIDKGRVVEQTGPRASRNQLQTTTLLDAMTSTASTPRSAARAATRSARARRSGSSRSATTSASGTRARSAPSSGTSTTARSARASRCASSRSPTGPSSTSGSTSRASSSSCRRSTSRTSARSSARDGMLYAASDFVERYAGRGAVHRVGALPHRRRHVVHRRRPSDAATIDEVVAEIAATRVTERGETRADDRFSEAAMEDRKRVGYF